MPDKDIMLDSFGFLYAFLYFACVFFFKRNMILNDKKEDREATRCLTKATVVI